MEIRRRDFLRLLGATSSFALAYGYGLFPHLQGSAAEALARQAGDNALRPPEEGWVPSVCQQCSGGCGILVRVVGERAVKIDGNPLHPINRGRLCARGQAGLQLLYDPDRLKGPLRRAGERGEGNWEEISWDEALAAVGDKLAALRSRGRPYGLAMLTGPQRGLSRSVAARFMEAYGSPNLIRAVADRSLGMIPAVNLMQGMEAGITYDIADANFILSFNSGLLEDHWSEVQLARAYGDFRRGRDKLRGKVVHIEPRLSVTGAKADRWIPIHPGSEGVLAMGIAAVLIIERRYDEEFVATRTFGFEDWTDDQGTVHPGFRTLVVRGYPLEKVVETTGVPRDVVTSLAREFARRQPAIAIGSDAAGVGNPGIYNRMAIHALNALVGSIQKPGGVLANARMPEMPLPPFTPDAVAARGWAMGRLDLAESGRNPLVEDLPDNLAARILTGKPYPLEVLFLHGANPLFQNPEPQPLVTALRSVVPTVVSFSPFMDETTRFADLVLPDSTYLEKWQLDTSYTLKGNPVVNVAQPVVAPVNDTRDTSEVLVALARRLGEPFAGAFPGGRCEALIRVSLEPLHGASRGEAFGAPLEEMWTTLLERSGWRVRSREPFEKFWADVQERGGWWDPVYYFWEWSRVLSTPSKKFELYSQIARAHLQEGGSAGDGLAVPGTGLLTPVEAADLACMPHGDPGKVEGNDTLFDLEVNPYLIPILGDLVHTNQPWLQDLTGFHLYQRWHTWVEIHPHTAHRVGVGDGDWVWVTTRRGKIKGRVRFFEGAMPDVVNLPVGLGHTTGGRWTAGIGEDLLRILEAEREPFTDRVRLQRSRAYLRTVKG